MHYLDLPTFLILELPIIWKRTHIDPRDSTDNTHVCSDFPYGKNPGFPNNPCPVGKAVDKSGFGAAVAAAKAADVAVVFVGSDQTTGALQAHLEYTRHLT